MLRLLARLDSIDPRWLYLCTAMAVALPLFINVPLHIRMGHEAHGLYDTIENLPPNAVVILHSDWDAGVLGECKGQFTAVAAHLMKRGIKFIVVSSNPTGEAFSRPVLERLARDIYHRTYWTDWVSFGYCIPGASVTQRIQAMSKDVQGVLPDKDTVLHRSKKEIPWLRGIGSFGDVALVVSFGYNPFLDYITFGTAVYGMPYACGIASINSTNLYPFLNTHQLRGMLVGARGGAEYEQMVGLPLYDREQHKLHPPGYVDLSYATKVIKSQSWAHLMLIFGAVLGNVGFWARRRIRAREAE